MKSIKSNIIIYSGNRKSMFIKLLSLLILIVFSLHLYILPSVSALTVEEQAAKKNKNTSEISDEDFSRKAPADRAVSRGAAEKDPRLACLLSLILPGGGQIYLRQDLKGIAFFSLTVLGYSASGYFLYKAINDDLDSSEKKSKLIISGLFLLLGIVFHVVGIVEAYNDAIEINEKNFYYGGYSKDPYIAELDINQ